MGISVQRYARFTFAIALVFALFTVTTSINSDSSGVAPSNAPRLKADHSNSINWSGYAAETVLNNNTTDAGTVTDVSGSWTVPSVNCSGVKSTAYSAAWVGIDGYSDSTVEQIGTDQDCSKTHSTYFAWYEMYPAGTQVISTVSVSPNDVMTAEVKYLGNNQFQLSIGNTTQHTVFSTTQTATVQRSSAEWIMEAPGMGTSAALANFGTIYFTNAQATISGTAGPIDGSSRQYDKMNMVNFKGRLKASTSSLTDSNNTSSFNVNWVSSK